MIERIFAANVEGRRREKYYKIQEYIYEKASRVFLYQQKDLLDRYFNEASTIFLVLGILFALYLAYKGWKFSRSKRGK